MHHDEQGLPERIIDGRRRMAIEGIERAKASKAAAK
jgi:hypothetical protein